MRNMNLKRLPGKVLLMATASLALLAAMTSQATADWKFAKWKMSVDEVSAAAQNTGLILEKTTKWEEQEYALKGTKAVLKLDLEDDDVPQRAFFNFDESGLSSIQFYLQDPGKAADWRRKIEARFGESLVTRAVKNCYEANLWRDGSDVLVLIDYKRSNPFVKISRTPDAPEPDKPAAGDATEKNTPSGGSPERSL